MLTNLKIENFQSHKSTNLCFDKGVNAIIGKSDNGKTAAMRALYWVIKNKPNGKSFIRHGKTTAKVELKVNGNSIVRMKNDKENQYILNGEILKAFGQDVPEEITELTRVDLLATIFPPPFPSSSSSKNPHPAKISNEIAVSNLNLLISNSF